MDYVGNGSSFTTLVFEPVYQSGGVGALVSNTWQSWDAIKGGNAVWWSSAAIPGVCAFSCYVSWNTILTNNPNAKVKTILGFNIGSGWVGQFTGYADGLTIRTTAGTKTYDFEPTAPVVTGNALVVTPSSPVFDSKNVNGVAGDSAPGFAGGSFASNGIAKTDMYFTPSVLFDRDVALGEVKSMSYWTKKGTEHVTDPRDWFLAIYTKPYPGQSGGGWYGTRIGSEPYFSENLADPIDTWNQWTTGDGLAYYNNWLRFFESTYGYFGGYGDPHWDAFIGGVSLAGARGPGVPYATQPILTFSLQTGSAWAAGFTGQIDGFRIELSNGSVATVNFEIDDTTAPTITGSASPPANSAGWNNTDVTASFTCTDSEPSSGIAINTVAGSTLTGEGANQAVTNTGTCKDNVGNEAAPATVSGINIDKTQPIITSSVTPESPNGSNGWYTTAVTVAFSCTDALSGLAQDGSSSETFNTDGSFGPFDSDPCVDKADNTADAVSINAIQIDQTPPVFGACSGDSFPYGSGAQTVSVTASDALSGLDAAGSTLTGSVDTNNLGANLVTFTAKDWAGNTEAQTCTYQVDSMNQVKQQVLAELQALLPALAKPASDKVKNAIDHLTKSLNPKFWVDGVHLSISYGKTVFDEEKKTVHELEDVNPPLVVTTNAISSLVAVDRTLATVAIAESTKKPADIQKAQQELTKGDADRADGKFEEAVGHYKTAWDLAT